VRRIGFVVPLVAVCLTVCGVAAAEDADPPEENEDLTRASALFGGSFSSGNSKSYALNVSGRFAHRGGEDQIGFLGSATYGRATAPPAGAGPDAPETTIETDSMFYGQLRYDRFFLEKNAAFLSLFALRDTSSGFRARWAPSAGYQRILSDLEELEVWVETGWRLSFESLELDAAARTEGLSDRRTVHGPLAVVGAKGELSERFSYDVALDAWTTVQAADDVRLFATTTLYDRIAERFLVGANLLVRWHHRPIGDREPLDTQLLFVGVLDWESK
jgi:hypothetical protein